VSDGGGLSLQIDPNGGRYWRYNYRFGGKQKTLALGVFPDAFSRQSQGAARGGAAGTGGRHRSVNQEASSGQDLRGSGARVVSHWKTARNERHAHYVLKRLEADIFPEIRLLPLGEIPDISFP